MIQRACLYKIQKCSVIILTHKLSDDSPAEVTCCRKKNLIVKVWNQLAAVMIHNVVFYLLYPGKRTDCD